jgi:hypothetical protein
MSIANVSLEDKYRLERGTVFLTGMQALARLPMLQHELDRRAGLHTAGYVSGYRGSPLGGLDFALHERRALPQAARHHLPARPQRGPRRHRGLGHAAAAPVPRSRSSTASFRCGTARAPASIAAATSSSTPTTPAPRSTAACC